MEILEDNIVQHKLYSLDSLPEGYSPNLESKWSMLEAGLEGNTKNIIGWKPIAAAMVLLLGGGAFLLQQIKPQPKLTAGQLKSTGTVAQTVHQPTIPVRQETVVIAKHQSIKPQNKQSHLHVNIPEVPATIWEVTLPAVIDQPQNAQVFTNTPIVKVKTQQFVEIDFNDVPPSKLQNIEPSIAFRPFKLNTGQQSSVTNDNRTDMAFRLQKSF